MGVASLVLGILSIIFAWVPFLAIVPSIIGIGLGVAGKENLLAEERPAGVATAGIVLSIIALVISLIIATVVVLFFANWRDFLGPYPARYTIYP